MRRASGQRIFNVKSIRNERRKGTIKKHTDKKKHITCTYNEYKKESNNVFRSPELKELGNELELAIKFEGNVENSIFDNVKNDKIFSSLNSLINVTNNLATHDDLKIIIVERLGNFSNGWSKRKVKLDKNISKIISDINEIAQINNVINEFKDNIHEILVHSKKKAIKFSDVANEMEDYGLNVFENSESIGLTKTIRLLITISIVETLCIAFLLIYSIYKKRRRSVIPLDHF